VTKIAIAGMYVVAHDLVTAAQMNIVTLMPRVRALQSRLQLIGINARSPQTPASPIRSIAVVAEIAHLMLTRNRLIGVNVGTLLDLGSSQ
jgi:hypothetical protein